MNTLERKMASLFFCATAILGLVTAGVSAAQEANLESRYGELAARIIKTSVNVKPGEVVVISGGKQNLAVMEDLAIQARKAGGLVNMFIDTDRVARALWTQVPEKYLEQPQTYFGEWLRHTDVFIGLPPYEDSEAVFHEVPPERIAKAAKASQGFMDVVNASKVRGMFVGYPMPSDAARHQLDFSTYQSVFWDAVGADYGKISTVGNKLRDILENARTVRVTSPSGTDFTFSIGDRPIFVDDGIITPDKTQSSLIAGRTVSLPSGTLALTPIETSARGRVVIPRARCQNQPLLGVSFDFQEGRLENFKAGQGGECFQKVLAPYSGPKDVFASFQIGLNPAAKVIENPGDYRPDYAAGLVVIGIGDNEWLGGQNKVEGGGGFSFPIVNATVTIDGKPAVRNGQLTL